MILCWNNEEACLIGEEIYFLRRKYHLFFDRVWLSIGNRPNVLDKKYWFCFKQHLKYKKKLKIFMRKDFILFFLSSSVICYNNFASRCQYTHSHKKWGTHTRAIFFLYAIWL